MIQQQLSERVKENIDVLVKEIIESSDKHWSGWRNTPLWYWVLCLSGEAGELSNATKKHYRFKWGSQGKKLDENQFKIMATEEMGDIFIYWVLSCEVMGLEPDEVIRKCLIKNYKRVEP